MAKNLNSVSFAVLLFVLMAASTAEAVDCPGGCPTAAERVFLDECGVVPFPAPDSDCCACCKLLYPSPPLCWAVVEGTEKHCHCYKKKV